MSRRKDTSPLYGRTLAVLVLKALETMPAPITVNDITKSLVEKHEPGMRHTAREQLKQRVRKLADDYYNQGLLEREKKQGTFKIEYYAYTIKPLADARR